jgi:AhpD family alkylhydroperoxidase
MTALVPVLAEDAAPSEAGAPIRALENAFGFVPNLALAMAHAPAALSSYLGGLQAVGAALSPAEAQLVMLAASRANAANYGVAVHTALSRAFGVDEATIRFVRAGGEQHDDPRLRTLLRLAWRITERRPIRKEDVSGLSSAEIVELAFAVSLKQFANVIAALSGATIDQALRE